MLKNFKSIIKLSMFLCLFFIFTTGFTSMASVNNINAYTNYNRDFENGLVDDAGWYIRTSDTGWSNWNCCNDVSANVVNDSGTKALKVEFTALNDDYNNFTYAVCVPANIFEQYKLYTVTANVKGINTTNIHVYIIDMDSIVPKKLESSNTYNEINTTFCAQKEDNENYWILIRAFGQVYGSPSTVYIDSINISPASNEFNKTNFNCYISNDFFANMTESEKLNYMNLINSTVLLGNLDTAAGYLSELTSYNPKVNLIAYDQMSFGNAHTVRPAPSYSYVRAGYDGLKTELDHLQNYNGKTFKGRKLSYLLIHEFGHAYTRDEWDFSPEEITNFKRFYVMDMMNSQNTVFNDGYDSIYSNEYIFGDDHYTRDQWAESYKASYDTQIKNYGLGHKISSYNNDGITGAILKIQENVGWDAFKRTFAKYNTAEPFIASNTDNIVKFDKFMELLQESYNELNASASGNEVVDALGLNCYKYLRKMIETKSTMGYNSKEKQYYTVTFLDQNENVVDIKVVEEGASTDIPSGFTCNSNTDLSNITSNMVINGSTCDLGIQNIRYNNYTYGTYFLVYFKNLGQYATGNGSPINVSLRIQGKDYDKVFVSSYNSSLDANGIGYVSFTFDNGTETWQPPEEGQYCVTATVDYSNNIYEINESNNASRIQLPVNISGHCILEAELYHEAQDVEETSYLIDNNTKAIKSFNSGDYLTYKITVLNSGIYQINLRAATTRVSGKLDIYIDNVKASTITVSNTGNWTTYQTFEGGKLNLSAGAHTIKLVNTLENYNINWFELVPIDEEIFVETADYVDSSGIEFTTSTVDGGFSGIKSIDVDDYMTYNVNVTKKGPYQLNARCATSRDSATLDVYIDGVKRGAVSITNTGDWSTYETFNGNIINLTEGEHVIKLVDSLNKFNITWFEFVPLSDIILVEAEDYNTMEGIEIRESIFDGTNAIISIDKDDYLTYEINVSEAGTYHFNVNAATTRTSGKLCVYVDDVQVSTIDITNTGSWHVYETFDGTDIQLTEGIHTMKLVDTSNNYNLNWFKLTKN